MPDPPSRQIANWQKAKPDQAPVSFCPIPTTFLTNIQLHENQPDTKALRLHPKSAAFASQYQCFHHPISTLLQSNVNDIAFVLSAVCNQHTFPPHAEHYVSAV